MALMACLPLLFFAPLWLLAMAALSMATLSWRYWHRQRHWQLRGVPLGEHERCWQWRSLADERWRETTLEVHYLGPWLIALGVAGRRHWLWPDSASAEGLRDLRRTLLGGLSRHHGSSPREERSR